MYERSVIGGNRREGIPWGNRRAPMPTERERFQFLQQVPMLSSVDHRILWSLAYEGSNVEFEPREVVMNEGESSSDMRFYLVREGEAVVSTSEPLPGTWKDEEGMTWAPDGSRVAIDPVTGGRVLATLRPGDYFGESSLLSNEYRSATIRAGIHGMDVVAFDAQVFHGRIAEHVLVFRMIDNEWGSGQIPDVKRLGLFNNLPMRDLATVLSNARQDIFESGDAIVEQGNDGDRFYIVLDGEVVVERDGHNLAQLSRGDYFGETALLFSIPRTATVRADCTTIVWSISADAFSIVIRNHFASPLENEPPLVERSREMLFGRRVL